MKATLAIFLLVVAVLVTCALSGDPVRRKRSVCSGIGQTCDCSGGSGICSIGKFCACALNGGF
ncbi:hypothetical protein C0J52_24003 [Blattella germanica]|nr:hypothetical protein C0J52_24003 [Blattella germanica]